MDRKPFDAETCFPWSLMSDVIGILQSRNAQFLRYRDLMYRGQPPASDAALDREYAAWRGLDLPLPQVSRIAARLFKRFHGWMPRRPTTVVLQHDADRQPYKTTEMLLREEQLGVKSSAYFFVKRNMWDDDLEPYDLDVEELRRLEKSGFEIGYHLNSYELTGYDLPAALELAAADLAWLRQHFDIVSFVPHGGVRGPNGINNDAIPKVGPLESLVWAYNTRGFRFDISWSDGDIGFAAVKDPRELARDAPDGARLRFLMHPQYYGAELSPFWLDKPIARQPWWRELWGL